MNNTDYKIGDLQKNHHLVRLFNEKYGKFWYFTNLNLAANFTGCKRNHLEYAYLKGTSLKGWKVDIVDGINVRWEDINRSAEYLKNFSE